MRINRSPDVLYQYVDRDGDVLQASGGVLHGTNEPFVAFSITCTDGITRCAIVRSEHIPQMIEVLRDMITPSDQMAPGWSVSPDGSVEVISSDDASATLEDLKRRMKVVETTIADLLRQDFMPKESQND